MAIRIQKGLPAGDTGAGVVCKTITGEEYRITQNVEKRRHTLWKCVPGGFEKIKVSSCPQELYDEIPWTK